METEISMNSNQTIEGKLLFHKPSEWHTYSTKNRTFVFFNFFDLAVFFSVNITHCWISRTKWRVSGWSSGSMIILVLSPKPPPPPSKNMYFIHCSLSCVALTSRFAEKAEKRHMPSSGGIKTKRLNKRRVRMTTWLHACRAVMALTCGFSAGKSSFGRPSV